MYRNVMNFFNIELTFSLAILAVRAASPQLKTFGFPLLVNNWDPAASRCVTLLVSSSSIDSSNSSSLFIFCQKLKQLSKILFQAIKKTKI